MRGMWHIAATAALTLLVATPSGAVLSFFDIVSDSEVVAGPPYPTVCHRTDVAHEASGAFERDGQLAVGVRRAVDGDGNYIGIDLRASGVHASGSGFWESSCFDAMYCPGPGGGHLANESRLDVLVELTADDDTPGRLVALFPEFDVRDPLRYFDIHLHSSSAELLCLVEFDRGVRHKLTFLAELPPTMGLTSATVEILPQTLGGRRADPTEVASYFTARPDAIFDVRMQLKGDSGFDEPLPLMSVTVSGQFIGGISPVEETSWGAVKALFSD